VVANAEQALPADGYRFVVELPEEPLDAEADRDKLRQVVANLVDNARRHASSRVELSFRRTPDGAVVAVADDGAGIPEADRERVFDRFARLDDARDRDTGGTGLGLAIARELVRSRGGDLRLADSPTGGLLAEVVFGSSEDVPARRSRDGGAGASADARLRARRPSHTGPSD
jgi:signal transduction histidine kinase